jgi:hypothetical protein
VPAVIEKSDVMLSNIEAGIAFDLQDEFHKLFFDLIGSIAIGPSFPQCQMQSGFFFFCNFHFAVCTEHHQASQSI